MKNIFITIIKFYQRTLSPIKRTRCPFVPSCSQYGIESLSAYGVLKGSILSVWRILRCNPFNKGFYDPPSNWGKKLLFKENKKLNG